MRPGGRLFSGIDQLGRYRYTAARRPLPEHSHGERLEICYLLKGYQTYRVGDVVYRLRGGDVFLTFPGESHSTGGRPEEKGVLYWLIVSASLGPDGLLGLPERESAALLRQLLQGNKRHFKMGNNRAKAELDEFTRAYYGAKDPLRQCAMAHHLIRFLLEVASLSRGGSLRQPTKTLTPALEHIQQHLGEPLTVPDLATLCNLSTPRFKVRFREAHGIPPGEYIQRARVAAARQRLSEGRHSITDIAYELGFSSSQYFATVFKRITGLTPRQAQREKLKEKIKEM